MNAANQLTDGRSASAIALRWSFSKRSVPGWSIPSGVFSWASAIIFSLPRRPYALHFWSVTDSRVIIAFEVPGVREYLLTPNGDLGVVCFALGHY